MAVEDVGQRGCGAVGGVAETSADPADGIADRQTLPEGEVIEIQRDLLRDIVVD
jgi:hypothetical protein